MNPIQPAIEQVKQELSIIKAERRAFQRFREMLRPMAVVSGRHDSKASPVITTLADVREAYEETVMKTPDYGTIYERDVEQSIAEELSPALVTELCDDGPLTVETKRRVLRASEAGITQREAFHEVLDQELLSLEAANSELTTITEKVTDTPSCSVRTRSFEEVLDVWRALDELEDRCDEVASNRQQVLRETRAEQLSLGDPVSLDEYLYSDLDVTHPVLRTVADTVQKIDEKRSQSTASLRHA